MDHHNSLSLSQSETTTRPERPADLLEAREPHAWRSYPKLAITYFGDLVFLLLTLYSLSLNYLEAWRISQKSVLIILFIVVWSHF